MGLDTVHQKCVLDSYRAEIENPEDFWECSDMWKIRGGLKVTSVRSRETSKVDQAKVTEDVIDMCSYTCLISRRTFAENGKKL